MCQKGSVMFGEYLENVKAKHPLIHNITNYVTANDCANLLLACGASPIMADAAEEVEEITEKCAGLVINLGTLKKPVIPAMLAAGKKSNACKHPLVLDPVGVGASAFRTETALDLLRELSFQIIRGNASEIRTLAEGSGATNGVDASAVDMFSRENTGEIRALGRQLAQKTKAIVVVTGESDLVINQTKSVIVQNGHPLMSKVTGTGCQLSALITAFAATNQESLFEAVTAAVAAMGLCGELAASRMQSLDGNASYRNYIIDALYNLTAEELERGARCETLD